MANQTLSPTVAVKAAKSGVSRRALLIGATIAAGGGMLAWTLLGSTKSASVLSTPEQTYDFGVISMKNGNVYHVFKIANPADKDIMIEQVSTSCMCTVAYILEGASRTGPFGMPGMGYGSNRANKLFKAGDTMNIEVVFDPNAHGPAGVGPMERSVHLTDAGGGALHLEIKALVKP